MSRSVNVVLVLLQLGQAATAVDLLATSYYVDENCTHTPQIVTMDFTYDSAAAESYVAPAILQSSTGILSRRLAQSIVASCVADPNCTTEVYGANTYHSTSECITDPYTYSVQAFGGSGGVGQPFLMVETYTGDDCATLISINATVAADGCQFASENSSSSATLFSNGSALFQLYDNGACGGNVTRYSVDRATLLNHTCYGGNTKFYTNYDASVNSNSASGSDASGSNSSDSGTDASVYGGTVSTPTPTSSTTSSSQDTGLSAGAIVGIIVGVLALMFMVAAVIWRSRVKSRKDSDDTYHMGPNEPATMSTDPNSQDVAPHGLEAPRLRWMAPASPGALSPMERLMSWLERNGEEYRASDRKVEMLEQLGEEMGTNGIYEATLNSLRSQMSRLKGGVRLKAEGGKCAFKDVNRYYERLLRLLFSEEERAEMRERAEQRQRERAESRRTRTLPNQVHVEEDTGDATENGGEARQLPATNIQRTATIDPILDADEIHRRFELLSSRQKLQAQGVEQDKIDWLLPLGRE
ncbi:uncharacterized protein KRP23_6437 [Phytophthora ramorum]|uniref:uncharacterized protein n=1 Tax=Phytophthora ramorum TaxID=164328 RepID=UPI0030A80502|nr:hypothetical protein KRP23_6437 [Phytophthora ramorum]